MMMGCDTGLTAVAGGPTRHVPVLVRPAVDFLNVRDGGVYVDATFGAGGYSSAILDAADCRVIALDRDPMAIAAGADLVEKYSGRLTLVQARFSELEDVARQFGFRSGNGVCCDGIVFDLGVSSMQLDEPERGFSFRYDGPLDMRMGAEGPSAADIVARASERDLANIIFTLGEERHSRGIARAIVAARQEAPIRTTRALANIVSRIVHGKPGEIHPATRTFQALRIFVNEELVEIVDALKAAEHIVAPKGRLVFVSFHSLEDRIVKNFFVERSQTSGVSRHAPEPVREKPSLQVLTKRPLVADAAETIMNPRARSAKLRAAERTCAKAPDHAPSGLLPHLPALDQVLKGH